MPSLNIRTRSEPAVEGELVIVVEQLGELHLARLEAEPAIAGRLGLTAESHTGLAWTGADEATVLKRCRAWITRKADILED